MSAFQCSACGAPKWLVELPPLPNQPPKLKNEQWRFDGERYLREKIAALTDDQLADAYTAACNRESELHDAEVGPAHIRAGTIAALRASLLETLLGASVSHTTTPKGTG